MDAATHITDTSVINPNQEKYNSRVVTQGVPAKDREEDKILKYSATAATANAEFYTIDGT